MSKELGREAPCAPDQPLCEVLRGAGRATRPQNGAWLGVALPCIESDGDRAKELTRALQGDLGDAAISGLRFQDGKVQVFAMNPNTDAERRMLDEVRSQFLGCLSHPGSSCRMRVDPAVLDAIQHPEAEPAPFHRDDADHLVARGEDLTLEIGHTVADPGWWVVNEHREHEVTCNWLDIVVAVDPVAR